MSNESFIFSTSQLFSYYPKYEYLDNIISFSDKKRLNLYVDVKGCGQALYQEWAVKQILFQSLDSRVIDTSVFSSIIEFVSFHKTYARKRNIDLYIYLFMETGESEYHAKIYPEYKSNRKKGDFFGLDMEKKEFFYTILQKNYIVTEKILNKLPNVYFIRLERLEADFVPWYLMNRCLSRDSVDSSIHVIYSTDKDMFQCLDIPDTYQFYRHYKNVKMISEKDIYQQWPKMELDELHAAEWFPMVLSIIGDESDSFKGVKGIGPKTLIRIFPYIKTICGNSMNQVYLNISKNIPIFKSDYKTSDNALKKIIDQQDIIVRNLKLSSYKLLSDYVDGDYPVNVFEKKKKIFECVNNENKCSRAGILHSALVKSGQPDLISEQTLLTLFGG